MLASFYQHVAFPFNVISNLAKSQILHANKLKGNKCVTSFREPTHILIHLKISITDGMFYYYPYNIDKVCSSYLPAVPKHVKTKFGNALWNDLIVH